MRYYIIVGENSGDLHGANLVAELKSQDPKAEFRFWGGDRMISETGNDPVKHIKDLAFMGFVEVLLNLRTILRNIKLCKEDIINYNPDAVILVDYPGFNLRIAEFTHKNNIKTIYYISPQVWAWKASRVKKIKKFVDKMLVILPFEKDFYQKYNYEVEYVGHPLLDELKKFKNTDSNIFIEKNNLEEKPIIALLPGSRKQEIKAMLPLMLSLQKEYLEYQFVVAGVSNISKYFYLENGNKNIKIIYNDTYNLLSHSHLAVVTSGTATLETGLLGVPQVVCYKGNPISYSIGKRLVKIKYISLVNLILDAPIITELIQNDFTTKNLTYEVEKLMNTKGRVEIKKHYSKLENILDKGGASKLSAKSIISFLENKTS